MERGGIAQDARPVTLESEEHAVGHAQGGEYAPSREQPDLAGREGGVGDFADGLVVKEETVEHQIILARAQTTSRRCCDSRSAF